MQTTTYYECRNCGRNSEQSVNPEDNLAAAAVANVPEFVCIFVVIHYLSRASDIQRMCRINVLLTRIQ